MQALEQTQVVLRLIPNTVTYVHTVPETGEEVTGVAIHKQMDKNRVWRNDSEGKYVELLFDGQPIAIRPGKAVQVGSTVAKNLMRAALIPVGPDKLNGPYLPFLEIVREFMTGSQDDTKPQFACPICGEDQETAAALSRHLMSNTKKHPKPEAEAKDDTNEEA